MIVFHANEPAGHSLVDERGVRQPVEGVRVREGALVDQTAFSFQLLHDGFVCSLEGA